MKALIVFDSQYGNTERVAHAIASSLECEVLVERANNVLLPDWRDADLIVVGSPTQGGRPSFAVQAFLGSIPDGAFESKRVAAFDTRIVPANVVLRVLIRLVGYAARRIDSQLKAKGGREAILPEGFIVEGREGPLRPGELERAARWAKTLHLETESKG